MCSLDVVSRDDRNRKDYGRAKEDFDVSSFASELVRVPEGVSMMSAKSRRMFVSRVRWIVVDHRLDWPGRRSISINVVCRLDSDARHFHC